MPRPVPAEERAIEVAVIRTEAQAHVARMRLHLQRSFWTSEPFAAVKRSLLGEVESYARKVSDEGEAA
jgi:hypothetical protein